MTALPPWAGITRIVVRFPAITIRKPGSSASKVVRPEQVVIDAERIAAITAFANRRAHWIPGEHPAHAAVHADFFRGEEFLGTFSASGLGFGAEQRGVALRREATP